MRSVAVWMLIFGVGGFVLPMMGVQFKILNALGDNQYYVAGGLAAVGAVLLVVSFVAGSANNAQGG